MWLPAMPQRTAACYRHRFDLTIGNREFFWPTSFWVVTPRPIGRRIMAHAKIIYIQSVMVAGQLAMSGIEHSLQSAFDWNLFPT